MMEFWNYSVEKTLEELGVSAAIGLNENDVSERLLKYGENALKGEKQKSWKRINKPKQ